MSKPPSTSTERVKKHRARLADGKIKLELFLLEDNLIAALLEARLICPADADNRAKVIDAAQTFFKLVLETRFGQTPTDSV